MPITEPRWIQYGERVVGEASPSGYSDVANRPTRDLYQALLASGQGGGSIFLNPRDPGFAGGAKADGSDDWAAIEATILEAYTNGPRSVFLPDSKTAYRVSRPVWVREGVTFSGAGHSKSTLSPSFAYGPTVVVGYHDNVLQDQMVSPLLTGAGYAMRIGAGSPFASAGVTNVARFWLRDAVSCELGGSSDMTATTGPSQSGVGYVAKAGLAAFAAEMMFKPSELVSVAATQAYLLYSDGRFTAADAVGATGCFSLILHSSNKFRATLKTSVSGLKSLVGTTTVVANTAYHVALTYDGVTIRLFVNGALDASVAATGTLVQDIGEEVIFGAFLTVPLDTGTAGFNHAKGDYDGIRLSKVARYTGAFTTPTAKAASDADTLFLLNFDLQYGPLTRAYTKDGDFWLWDRSPVVDPALYGGAAPWSLHDFGITCGFLNGHGQQSGIVVGNHGYHGQISWVDVIFARTAAYVGSFNDYFTHINDFVSYGYGARYGLVLGKSSGLMHLDNCQLTGGIINFVVSGYASVLVSSMFLQLAGSSLDPYPNGPDGGRNTLFGALIFNADVGGTVTFSNCNFNSETGLDQGFYRALLCVENHLETYGRFGIKADACVFEKNYTTEPVVLIGNAVQVMEFSACVFMVNDATPSIVAALPGQLRLNPAIFINSGIRRLGATAAPSPVPLAVDSALVVQLGTAGGRVIPVVEKLLLSEQVATVAIDAGAANAFTIRVRTATAITISSPIKGRIGQSIRIEIRNESGGVMGATTWGLAYGLSAWTKPATGFSRSIVFTHNGLAWTEVSRTPADVPIPAFTPADFSGRVVHFDANTLGLVDNDPVGTWADQSGGARDLTQATAGNKPLFKTNILNGKPVVRFDGTDDWMSAVDAAAFDVTDFTFFVVAKVRVVPPAEASFVLMGRGYEESYDFGVQGVSRQYFQASTFSPVENMGFSTSYTAGTFYLFESVLDATLGRGYQNGERVFIGTISAPDASTQALRVGGNTLGGVPTQIFDGDIAEIVFYNRALVEDERLQLEQYFQNKYGITVIAVTED